MQKNTSTNLEGFWVLVQILILFVFCCSSKQKSFSFKDIINKKKLHMKYIWWITLCDIGIT